MKYLKTPSLFKKKEIKPGTFDISSIDIEDIEDNFIELSNCKISTKISNIGKFPYIPGIHTHSYTLWGKIFATIVKTDQNIKSGAFDKSQKGIVVTISFENIEDSDKIDSDIMDASSQVLKRIDDIEIFGIMVSANSKSNLLIYTIGFVGSELTNNL